MTQQEILKNNMIIAAFVGYIRSDNKDIDVWEMNSLRYHESWDWLMPVVEKIERMGFDVVIKDKHCHLHRPSNAFGEYGYGSTKIYAVYTCVLNFISWFNTKNNKTP